MSKPTSYLNKAIQTAVMGHNAISEKYNLYWVNNDRTLDFAAERGLLDLYKQVFAEPPYNEEFTHDQVYAEFQETLKKDGYIFIATERQGLDRALGFVSSLPLNQVPDIAQIVNEIVDPDKTAYFAEDGVEKYSRRKGVSSLMKNMLIQANWMSGNKNIVLRTSDQNYRQIAAVTKIGGQIITNIFQNVASPRQGGEIMQDRRAFYIFTPENDTNYDYLQRVSIVRPGGNDTAIVWDNIPRRQQGAIAASIQEVYPGVEQVMFVERNPDTGQIRGQMAGGEFCGNATRSLGFLMLNGKNGNIDLEISGANELMRVTVSDNQAMTAMPIKADLLSVLKLDSGEFIANLDGISHLVTYDTQQYGSRINAITDMDERKAEVKKILSEIGIIGKPASGIMIVNETDLGQLSIDPYVYVRDTGTLYYETGCGSGTTAVAMAQAINTGKSVTGLNIKQPSGLSLIVDVNRNDKAFESAYVSGEVEIIYDSKLYLPRQNINGAMLNPELKLAI